MQRFVYTPRINAFIINERSGQVLDVSDDIINGNVVRRLNAMSTATLTLQNKQAKYLQQDTQGKLKFVFEPMDRIVIHMSRLGEPMTVFSGYLDEVPYYQLYPGPITLQASDSLKLLQYTYFDPGLPFMQQFFARYGWEYDPASGTLYDPTHSLGNLDVGQGIGHVITDALTEIANWPLDMIRIINLPDQFIKNIAKEMVVNAQEEDQAVKDLADRLRKMLSIDTSLSTGTGTTLYTNPVSGNVAPEEVAQLAINAGFKGDNLITAVAVAWAESHLKSDADNYNTDGSWDYGLWQINTVHCVGAPGSGRGLSSDPAALPQVVKNFRNAMFTPQTNAAQAFSISGSGTSFHPWATFNSGAYKDYLADAQVAVKAAALTGGGSTSTPGVLKPPGSNPTQTTNTDTATTVARKTVGKYVNPFSKLTGLVPERIDQGVDYAATGGDIVAIGKGKVINIIPNWYQGTPFLWYQLLDGDNAGRYVFVAEGITPRVSPGQPLQAGQVIASYNPGNSTGIETGFATASGAVIDPYNGRPDGTVTEGGKMFARFLKSLGVPIAPGYDPGPGPGATNDATSGIAGNDGASQLQGVLSPQDVAQIAKQAAWFTLQFQNNDMSLSELLTGKRAIANDVPFLEWITNIIPASGRVWCSHPDGSFLAFYPDYFGYYKRTPYFNIADIEIVDLQIQRNDTNLVTHVFTTGPVFDLQISLEDRFSSAIASVEEPVFNAFINVPSDDPAKLNTDQAFDPIKFLQRYGARPYSYDLADVKNPVLLWMAGWMKFTELWSKQFTANGTFTFLPEVLPGGLVSFGNRISMFVEEVTHTFDRSSGFTTTATLSAPAAIDQERFPWLPKSGPLQLPAADTSHIDSVPQLTPGQLFDKLPGVKIDG